MALVSRDAEVCIEAFYDAFKSQFLVHKNGSEAPHPGMNLRVHRLTRVVENGPILECLGGESAVEVPLAVVFELLRRQRSGEDGVLSTTGSINVCFVRSPEGDLVSVRTHWYRRGWFVGSYPLSRPVGWQAGTRIVSRSVG